MTTAKDYHDWRTLKGTQDCRRRWRKRPRMLSLRYALWSQHGEKSWLAADWSVRWIERREGAAVNGANGLRSMHIHSFLRMYCAIARTPALGANESR